MCEKVLVCLRELERIVYFKYSLSRGYSSFGNHILEGSLLRDFLHNVTLQTPECCALLKSQVAVFWNPFYQISTSSRDDQMRCPKIIGGTVVYLIGSEMQMQMVQNLMRQKRGAFVGPFLNVANKGNNNKGRKKSVWSKECFNVPIVRWLTKTLETSEMLEMSENEIMSLLECGGGGAQYDVMSECEAVRMANVLIYVKMMKNVEKSELEKRFGRDAQCSIDQCVGLGLMYQYGDMLMSCVKMDMLPKVKKGKWSEKKEEDYEEKVFVDDNVQRARWKQNGSFVAIKTVKYQKLSKSEKRELEEDFQKGQLYEIDSIRYVESPYVQHCFDRISAKRMIISPLMVGDVNQIIQDKSCDCKPHDVFRILYDACRGMCVLHLYGVIHGDIKEGNILVTFEGGTIVSKLNDIGYSLRRIKKCTYCPKEEMENISQATDVFAFGKTFRNLLSMKVLDIFVAGKEETNSYCEHLMHLMDECMEVDANNRPTSYIVKQEWSVLMRAVPRYTQQLVNEIENKKKLW